MRINIAVIGDRESVLGFKAAGFSVFEAEGKAFDLSRLMADLAEKEYGILFVTEDLMAESPGAAGFCRDRMLPAVVPIPGRGGSLGIRRNGRAEDRRQGRFHGRTPFGGAGAGHPGNDL